MTLYGTGSAPKTELLINGVWTDVSSRPRAAQKAVITRGRANEQSRLAAQTANLTLENTDGYLSNRNPNSPYFGLLPRNTQVRVSAGAGDTYLKAVYSDQTATISNVSTADKAVLRITGDIDIRCDVQPYSWRTGLASTSVQGMTLASRGHSAGSNLSWVFYLLGDGTLRFRWYPAGTTAGQLTATSTVPVPSTSGRLTVRVTLDVDNGASGNTVAFYTSDSVTGTFTQLGASVVQSGTTSIAAGTANLVFAGGSDTSTTFFSDIPSFGGRFYRGQVYSGIAGTLRADADPTSRSIGDTSWSDGLGTPNTWTLTGNTRVTTDRLRFWGELSSLPQQWDNSGTDVTVPVTAAGMIRRLTQGASPVQSAMTRNFSQYASVGYWPLEDGSDSTSASSGNDGGRTGTVSGTTFGGSNDGIPGTASVAQFSDATGRMYLLADRASSTGVISLVCYINLSSLPATSKSFISFDLSGTVRMVTVGLTTTTWETNFYAADGTVLGTASVANTNINPINGWIGVNVFLDTSGGNVRYSIRWDAISTYGGGVGPTSLGAGSVGVPLQARLSASNDAAYNSLKVAQVFMSTTSFDLSSNAFRKASSAWINETACARLTRLSQEQGIPIEVWGVQNDSELMGAQTVDTFMNLVYDCTDTDGGVLGECRDALSLFYRSRTSLENRSDVSLSYASSHLDQVPLPTEDDQAFTNDVTVSRPGGGSARAVRTDGPTSVSSPPSGVGRYTTAVSRNVADEDRLDSVAGWLMLTGSWDDARYPQLSVSLHRSEITATLFNQVMAVELGDTATLTGLPSWLPPDNVPELIQGYRETLDKFTWTIVYNCTPAGPYLSGWLGSDAAPPRMDATSHTIGGSLTTTGTSVSLVTPAGSAVWVNSTGYPSEFPFTAKIAGEVVTVTAITGTASPQTATITRSVNGIVKTHSSGELIRLAVPYYVGR